MAERILRRELKQHLTGMDNMCFQVDDPRRHMTICSVWTFNNRLDTTLVMAGLENLCNHYPRFCLVPKHGSLWETSIWSRPHQHWKFRDNFTFHTLANPTLTCLQHYVASQYMKPLDRDKPLWEAHLISGLENKQFAFLWKVHRSLSDDIGIIRAILATTTSLDPKEEMYRQWQQQQQQQQQTNNDQLRQRQRHRSLGGGGGTRRKTNNKWHRYPSSNHRHRMARQKYQQLQFENATRKFGLLWQQMMIYVLWGWSLVGMVAEQVHYEFWLLGLLVSPWLHAFFFPLRFFLFRSQQQQLPKRIWSYDDDQTREKLMAWTDDLDQRDLQRAQRMFGGGTLDDMILLILGRTMQQYSIQQQQQHMDNNTFRILLPVSFRLPMDWSMKNATTGGMMELTMDDGASSSATGDLLVTIHRHRMALQRSLVPYMVHYVIIERLLRYFPFLMVLPSWIRQWYTDLLPHASMTSIAASTTPVFFGGQKIKECYVVPTQCDKGSISVSVVSYGDKLNLSIFTDNHPAYPDLANTLCKLFVSEFNTVVDEAMVMANGYGGDGIIM